jgi:hypothetical protein
MRNEDTLPKRKTPKAFRLSDQGEALLVALSDHLGVKQTAVIEMAIRRMAKTEGVTTEQSQQAA